MPSNTGSNLAEGIPSIHHREVHRRRPEAHSLWVSVATSTLRTPAYRSLLGYSLEPDEPKRARGEGSHGSLLQGFTVRDHACHSGLNLLTPFDWSPPNSSRMPIHQATTSVARQFVLISLFIHQLSSPLPHFLNQIHLFIYVLVIKDKLSKEFFYVFIKWPL